MHGYITLSQEGINIVSGEQTKDDPMILMTRQSLLITLCTLLMISLFTPQLPQSTEQWLTTLLLGLLVAVALYRFAPSFYDNVDLIVNRIPCFIFGALLGRLSHERRPLPMPVVAACLTAVAVMLYPMQLVDVPLVKVYLRAALNLLLCICGVVIMDVMARAGKLALAGLHDVVSKVLSWFGRYSLELYLLHVMIRKMLNLNDLPTTHLRYEAVVIIGAIALSIPLKRLCNLIQHRLLHGKRLLNAKEYRGHISA